MGTLLTFCSYACSPAAGVSSGDAGPDVGRASPCAIEHGVGLDTQRISLSRDGADFSFVLTRGARTTSLSLTARAPGRPSVVLRVNSAATTGTAAEFHVGDTEVFSLSTTDGSAADARFLGRRLRSGSLDAIRDAARTGVLVAEDGTRLADSTVAAPAGWRGALEQIADLLRAPQGRCDRRNRLFVDDPASIGSPLSHPGSAPVVEDTNAAAACVSCRLGCQATLVGCVANALAIIAGAAATLAGCGANPFCAVFSVIAFVLGVIALVACIISGVACNNGCSARPGPCCPVECGTTACCLSGHTCADATAGTCCPGPSIPGINLCCNAGETVFRPLVGAPLCCQGTTCNGAPGGVGFCCGGNLGDPGGACPGAAANMALQAPGCCAAGATCRNAGTAMARCCNVGDTPISNGRCCPIGNDFCGIGAECCAPGSCGTACVPTPTY